MSRAESPVLLRLNSKPALRQKVLIKWLGEPRTFQELTSWLAASGDADQALRLLTWVDGPYFIHPSAVYSLMLTGLVDLERGRIEEQRGRAGSARTYYREFLRRYDRPVIGHRRLVEEAKTAMVRLTGRGD